MLGPIENEKGNKKVRMEEKGSMSQQMHMAVWHCLGLGPNEKFVQFVRVLRIIRVYAFGFTAAPLAPSSSSSFSRILILPETNASDLPPLKP